MENFSIYTNDISLVLNGKQDMPIREEFYTNYPFFKYWRKETNSKLETPEGINIYIHIPFCKQICDFCFYMKELVSSREQVDEYIEYLCRSLPNKRMKCLTFSKRVSG